MKQSIIWKCCGNSVEWTYRDLVEKGAPVCSSCDGDMEPTDNTDEAKKMYCQVFYFKDLDDIAKEEAREWYRQGHDVAPLLDDFLYDFIETEVRLLGYTINSHMEVRHSLSYCQGDGVSFTCTISKDGKEYFVLRDDGRYVHENTMYATFVDDEGIEKDANDVTKDMRQVARKAENAGYKYIEQQSNDNVIDENIALNEYTFTRDGIRIDADM